MENKNLQFRLLKADEIDARIGSVGKSGYSILLYKDARVDMTLLDETVGSNKWQRKHYELKDNLYCSVGIYFDDIGWVWKDDCGAESFSDKEKGEASDSFKRACVNWGIGRELYTSPFIFVNAATIYDKSKKKYKLSDFPKFKVTKIEYTENREISNLVISNSKTNEILFAMNKVVKKQDIDFDKVLQNSIKKEPVKEESSQTTLKNAGDFIFPFGKNKGKAIKQIYEEDKEYLDWCLTADFIKQDTKNLISEFLEEINKGYKPELEEVEIDGSLPF